MPKTNLPSGVVVVGIIVVVDVVVVVADVEVVSTGTYTKCTK
jgi:hypothetical protein